MTNETSSAPSLKKSLAIRWAVATALVFAVGAAGFLLHGQDTDKHALQRVAARAATKATAPDAAGDGIAFPDIPDITIPDFGDSTAPPATRSSSGTDFSRCRADAVETPPTVPADWATYTSTPDDGVALRFRYPADWQVEDPAGGPAVSSADGSRAFVVETIPFDNANLDLPELLTTMAEMRPELGYSNPRPVVVDAKGGCAVGISGDGHAGQLVVLPTNGAVLALLTAHDVGADNTTAAELWTILTSVHVLAHS